jgi:hypothetical protein
MKKSIKRILVNLLKMVDLYSCFLLKRQGFLQQSGWFVSFAIQQPVDAVRRPIPWMTYSFIQFLKPKLQKEMVVFEYGCGNSTLWWANCVKQIISCEHDFSWYQKLQVIIPENVELHYIPLEYGGLYCKKISEYHKYFDIIIIDGRDRVNCARNSPPALKEDGIIIWDNSDRAIYQEGYDFLHQEGYKRLDFMGMGPINLDAWCTSVFYRSKNCLDL